MTGRANFVTNEQLTQVCKGVGGIIREALAPLQERLDAVEQKQARGIRFRGRFQPAETYGPGDIVSFDDSLWTCAKSTDGGEVPGQSGYWALMLKGVRR